MSGLPGRELDLHFQSEQEFITNVIGSLALIDTGIIQSIDNKGRATISANRALAGEQVVYRDVEIIGIGNAYGGLTIDGTGASCLIFVPRTTVRNVRDQEISWDAPAYSKNGVKALPITNAEGLGIDVHFDPEGGLHIVTKDHYLIDLTPKQVRYTQDGFVISINDTNNIYLRRRNEESGEFIYTLTDAGSTEEFTSLDKTLHYKKSITDTQVQLEVGMGTPSAGSEEDEWGNKIPVYPNTYKLSFIGGQCNITHVDDQGEALTTVTIGVDGGLTVSTPADVSLQANAVTVETEDALSITSGGDTSIEASGNVAVSAGTGKKITLTGPQGGKVEIE